MKYEIGGRIRLYRKQSGLTQEQLASKINVTKSRVSNWEQGINRPDADILADICRALNVSPSDLLDVHLSTDELTDHERKVIRAYRSKPEITRRYTAKIKCAHVSPIFLPTHTPLPYPV